MEGAVEARQLFVRQIKPIAKTSVTEGGFWITIALLLLHLLLRLQVVVAPKVVVVRGMVEGAVEARQLFVRQIEPTAKTSVTEGGFRITIALLLLHLLLRLQVVVAHAAVALVLPLS